MLESPNVRALLAPSVIPDVPLSVIAMIAPYSYRMFIEPASKLSVPLTVVRRMAVSAAPKDTAAPVVLVMPTSLKPTAPVATQRFEPMLVMITAPDRTFVTAEAEIPIPVVNVPPPPPEYQKVPV